MIDCWGLEWNGSPLQKEKNVAALSFCLPALLCRPQHVEPEDAHNGCAALQAVNAFCKLRENLHVLETYKKRAGRSRPNHSLSGEDG